MPLFLPSSDDWANRCLNDGEFQLASRHWGGGVRLDIGDETLELLLTNGAKSAIDDNPGGMIEISGSVEVWEKVLEANPERFHNDVMANISQGCGLQRRGDAVVFAQYYAAAMRAVELLRPSLAESGAISQTLPHDNRPHGTIDAPIGRYVHLKLDGHDHRIYFEEAGQGIPLLMQHTAGCHSSQWRHLFEFPEITERFRLIAYDLPCHGKSVPPVGVEWWDEQYLLKGAFLRSIPVKLSEALGLVDPVFMGCSVGGLLALDLAHKHSDVFRAVISVEGALRIEGKLTDYGELYHPQVNNEYKARLMDGLMASSSPKPYRKETSFVYACGWPPVFLGDLYYYIEDYDLRQDAAEIDTNAVGVHILSGEYDYSGTSELGKAAHDAIPGSTWQNMEGVGHFPMSENPQAFREYLLPILDRIAS
jgi:pimeloyl-ACP methyl ester carboxylesterase